MEAKEDLLAALRTTCLTLTAAALPFGIIHPGVREVSARPSYAQRFAPIAAIPLGALGLPVSNPCDMGKTPKRGAFRSWASLGSNH